MAPPKPDHISMVIVQSRLPNRPPSIEPNAADDLEGNPTPRERHLLPPACRPRSGGEGKLHSLPSRRSATARGHFHSKPWWRPLVCGMIILAFCGDSSKRIPPTCD